MEKFKEKNEAIAIFFVVSNYVPTKLIGEQDLAIAFKGGTEKNTFLLSIMSFHYFCPN